MALKVKDFFSSADINGCKQSLIKVRMSDLTVPESYTTKRLKKSKQISLSLASEFLITKATAELVSF